MQLSRSQVRSIDQLAIERYGLPGIVLMENAARAVTCVAGDIMGNAPSRVLIVAGTGNNGGDGFAVARHLHNRAHDVRVLVLGDGPFSADAQTNYDVVAKMGLEISPATPERITETSADLIIDALFGTGLTTAPRADAAAVINAINAHRAAKLAVDLPSGLDCDTGQPLGTCVRATRTVTFVAAKLGFTNPDSRPYTGEVTVGDIGCPRELIDEVRRGTP